MRYRWPKKGEWWLIAYPVLCPVCEKEAWLVRGDDWILHADGTDSRQCRWERATGRNTAEVRERAGWTS